ncbi:MAG: PAS domain-containing sensor histidine kinase [Gammaproteobacteria bacterium]|nr:PAS domain-containing sensor histidine kinase [Gammaproteobacteria bacterium]
MESVKRKIVDNENIRHEVPGHVLSRYRHIIGEVPKNLTFESLLESVCEYYENIIACMPGNVYWFDNQGIVHGCNRNVLSMYGLNDVSEFKGLNFDQIGQLIPWPNDVSEKFKQDSYNVIRTGVPIINEEEPPILDAEGNALYFLTSRVPLLDSAGERVGIVGISTEITSLKEAEKREKLAIIEAIEQNATASAEEALRRAVTVLAGSIAHDLRTPLTAALLRVDALAKAQAELIPQQEDKSYKELVEKNLPAYFDVVYSSIKNFKKIIYDMNNFIDVTLKSMQRLVSGTLSKEDFIVCDVGDCLHQIVVRYPFRGNEKNLLQLTKIDDFSFMGIPVLFYRIIFNLLGNAFHQIAKNNKGEIFISTEVGSAFNIVRVRDTAGGISPEKIDHLFDAYVTHETTGTGVGLAFCKLTMQNFGGDITCHSVEGDYIEFCLSFPTIQ